MLGALVHELLSRKLAKILEAPSPSGELTLNHLLERTEGRGLFTVIILLCLPFIAPVSVPGMSTPFGLAIAIMTLRFIRGKPPRLPKRVGDRALPPVLKRVLTRGGAKFLCLLETAVRPRKTGWMNWRAVQHANFLLMIFMALLLALPLPPIPPFTNAFPAYSIILLAASIMEEDGVLIWAGYGASLFTTFYFAVWAEVIATHFVVWAEVIATHLVKWIHSFVHFIHNLGL